MLEWIQDLAKSCGYVCGRHRMKAALNVRAYPLSRNQTRKLMREVNLQVGQRRRYQVTTSSSHKQPVFDPWLQREFDVAPLNRVYAADVTYICRREG